MVRQDELFVRNDSVFGWQKIPKFASDDKEILKRR